MDTNSPPAEPLSIRIARLRRTFVKGVGRNTTAMERLVINRAARLTAIAELAAENPDTPYTDIVRLDHSAARARADMAKVLQAKPAKQLGPDALRAYAREKYSVPA